MRNRITAVLVLGFVMIIVFVYSKAPKTAALDIGPTPSGVKLRSMEQFVQVRSELDGRPLMLDIPARLYEDQVLIPLRPLIQVLDLQLNWNQQTQTALIQTGAGRVQFTVGTETAIIGNKKVNLPLTPLEVQGTSLVPAAVLQALGVTVEWDGENKVIRMRTPDYVPPAAENRASSGTVSILMYHEIGDGPNSLYVRERDFKEQMQYLWENQYQVVNMSEAVRRLENQENLEKVVVLTFDDGYVTFYDQVWPVLKEYNFSATVYVITKNCEGNPDYLSWEQLQFLQANWMEVGSHTKNHPDLKTISTASLVSEVKGSRDFIEEHLIYPCRDFCYPSGAYNKEVVQVVRDAGYRSAVTVVYGKASRQNDPYLMPRLRIPRYATLQSFAQSIQ